MTYHGFDYLKFSLTGIESGISFISFAVDLTFKLHTKALVVTPRLNMGKLSYLELYLDIPTDYGTMASINGLELYGLEFITTFANMRIKDLVVFDTRKYAITTEEYGSVIEARATAVEKDHEFYPDYWEMFSIAMSGGGCRGGSYTFLANVYFQCDSPSLFDWGMTHIEALVPISTAISITGEIQVNFMGLNHFILGFEIAW